MDNNLAYLLDWNHRDQKRWSFSVSVEAQAHLASLLAPDGIHASVIIPMGRRTRRFAHHLDGTLIFGRSRLVGEQVESDWVKSDQMAMVLACSLAGVEMARVHIDPSHPMGLMIPLTEIYEVPQSIIAAIQNRRIKRRG